MARGVNRKGCGPLKTLEKASLAHWWQYIVCVAEALHE